MPIDAVDQLAQNEAALIDRIEEYRAQGRLRPEYDVGAVLVAASADVPSERQGSLDAWGHIVQSIATQSQNQNQSRGRRNRGKYIASQIASKIQTYWDGHAARKDRAKAQEEKRLRALAKSTIRTVVNEWKKAVFVSLFFSFSKICCQLEAHGV